MCDELSHLLNGGDGSRLLSEEEKPNGLAATSAGLSRRALLGAGAAAGGLTVLGLGASSARATQTAEGTGTRAEASRHRTRVVLVGTGGGPVLRNPNVAGISTAVAYGDRIYIVDLGHGAVQQYARSGLYDPARSPYDNLRGIFFTHMHSDHITEWPSLYMTSVMNTTSIPDPFQVQVFGPGDRDTLPRVYPPGRAAPAVVNPQRPMPGITGMTEYLRQAVAADLNDRMRDNNAHDTRRLFATRDLDISRYWVVDPEGIPPRLPAGTRLPVWQDGDVTVTATLVDHRPTAPAFGYRFDTPDGSIVISGDTAPSENLIDLASGADYLLHEVIDEDYVASLGGSLDPAQRQALQQHLLSSHTTIEQVGQVAERAQVRNLVLTHLVPATNDRRRWMAAQQGFSGRLVVGRDQLQLGVGARSR